MFFSSVLMLCRFGMMCIYGTKLIEFYAKIIIWTWLSLPFYTSLAWAKVNSLPQFYGVYEIEELETLPAKERNKYAGGWTCNASSWGLEIGSNYLQWSWSSRYPKLAESKQLGNNSMEKASPRPLQMQYWCLIFFSYEQSRNWNVYLQWRTRLYFYKNILVLSSLWCWHRGSIWFAYGFGVDIRPSIW